MVRCPTCKDVFSTVPSLPPEPEPESKQEPEQPQVEQKTISCPTCRSGLQVPADTAAMIRCPACKSVFSAGGDTLPPEHEEEEDEGEEESEEPDLGPITITCPTCRSGLQVPAGTTAMIRCPACNSIFSAADAAVQEEPKDRPKPRKKRLIPKKRVDDEPITLRRKRSGSKKGEKAEENRDFDPDISKKKAKKRRVIDDEGMSAAEKAELKAAFVRAAWGAKLIWVSILLFMLSMVLIVAFFFQVSLAFYNPAFLYAAGMVGLLNWILGAIGVGLCISGPDSKGHMGYGIAAAIATGLHLFMLLIVVASSKDVVDSNLNASEQDRGAFRWVTLATRLDILALYPCYLLFGAEQGVLPPAALGTGIACGLLETLRIILIMMLLSCLAQAGGDEELSRFCTRAAGTASIGPGVLSIVMLLGVGFVAAARTDAQLLPKLLLLVLIMGIYAILAGFMLRALMATRETIDVCEEPYKSQQVHL
jgi:uncharacterized CHY-type Zn-finger protein